jgi:integrase
MAATGKIENEEYFNFINSIKSDETRVQYESKLKLFMKFCNISDMNELKNIDAQKYLIQYISELRNNKLSSSAINGRLYPVFHFYEMNDIVLNKKKIKMFQGEYVKRARDRAYTHEEISRILNVSDLRMKVIILLMASSGMRIGSIPTLRLRNLEKRDQLDKVYKIIIYENSSEEYYTFCTPECASFIDLYLEYRQKNGEKLDKDSFLIRDQFDITDMEQIRNKSRGISLSTITTILHFILIKAGVKVVDHTSKHTRKEVSSSHGFRKFFTTQVVNSKVNPEIREMLLGHKIGLASAYYRPTEEEMYEECSKAIDNLTIDPANRLQRKVETLTIEKSRVDKLEEKIRLIEKMYR